MHAGLCLNFGQAVESDVTPKIKTTFCFSL